jgi:hypothetical protein
MSLFIIQDEKAELLPPGKRRKLELLLYEKKESRSELERSNERLQRKLIECNSKLQQKEEEIIALLQLVNQGSKSSSSGSHVVVSELPFSGIAWSRMPSESSYLSLCGELFKYLPTNIGLSVNPQAMLDLFFFSFSTGLTVHSLRNSFKLNGEAIPYSTLKDGLDAIFEGLSKWGRSKIHLLSLEEWKKDMTPITSKAKYQQYWKRLFYFVDGTVVRTLDSTDPGSSRAIRNGKHAHPAFVFFILVSPTGRIVYLSREVREGKVHDKTHFDHDGVSNILSSKYSVVPLEEGWSFALGGDKAYPYIGCPPAWKLHITKSGEESCDIDEEGNEIGKKAKDCLKEHVEFDPGIARLRGVVERVIGKVKSWGIFNSVHHCNDVQRVKWIVEISCGIVNWMFENGLLEKI